MTISHALSHQSVSPLAASQNRNGSRVCMHVCHAENALGDFQHTSEYLPCIVHSVIIIIIVGLQCTHRATPLRELPLRARGSRVHKSVTHKTALCVVVAVAVAVGVLFVIRQNAAGARRDVPPALPALTP